MHTKSIPVACDVVVVGAGLAGALIARRLAEENVSVAVLEADTPARGATARGLGLALLGTPEPYARLVERLGATAARDLWALTRENLNLLTATAERLEQPVATVGSLRITDSSAEATLVQQSAMLLAEAGFDATLEDATDLGFLIGVQTAGDLAFDPPALTHALLNHPGVVVQSHTTVQQIIPREDDLEIWARKHFIRTKAVVLTAGAHVVHLNPGLSAQLVPLMVHSAAMPAAENLATPLVLHDGQVIAYAQNATWQLNAWTPAPDVEAWTLLSETAQQLAPDAQLHRRDTTWVAYSRDGLPIVGELPRLPRVYTLSGLGPWGWSWIFTAAEHLLALMLHDTPPTSYFAPKRFTEGK